MQTDGYAIVKCIDHEPAFNWWVKHTLNMRDHIISIENMGITRCPSPQNNGNLPLPLFVGNYQIVLLDNMY